MKKFLNSSCDTPVSPKKPTIEINDYGTTAKRDTNWTNCDNYESMINGYFEESTVRQRSKSPNRNANGSGMSVKHGRHKSANPNTPNRNGSQNSRMSAGEPDFVLNGEAIDVSLVKNGRYMTKGMTTTASIERDGNSEKKPMKRNLKTLIKELKEQKLAQKLKLGSATQHLRTSL
jgi:hypothetical protein